MANQNDVKTNVVNGIKIKPVTLTVSLFIWPTIDMGLYGLWVFRISYTVIISRAI